MQEYFQAKIGRKIRIFSLGRNNNILSIKTRVYIGDVYAQPTGVPTLRHEPKEL